MSSTDKKLFSISEEEILFLKKNKNKQSKRRIPTNDVLQFLKAYNEMIDHRQKIIKPKQDGEWLI